MRRPSHFTEDAETSSALIVIFLRWYVHLTTSSPRQHLLVNPCLNLTALPVIYSSMLVWLRLSCCSWV